MTSALPISLHTILLLTLSNVFMTFAWYGHLKTLNHRAWYVAALVSWGIALFEYLLMVPANRIGAQQFSVGQLEIMQEVITLCVFLPFAVLYLREPLRARLPVGWAVPGRRGLFHVPLGMSPQGRPEGAFPLGGTAQSARVLR